MKANSTIDFSAVLLAGGFGTRLRSALPDLPKPLAPVRGQPFISYLLDRLANAGCPRAILCLHYKSEQIIQALGDRHGSMSSSIRWKQNRSEPAVLFVSRCRW